jgi:hypothetical protein
MLLNVNLSYYSTLVTWLNGRRFDELKDANFYTHLDLVASAFWQARVCDQNIVKTTFQTPHGLME